MNENECKKKEEGRDCKKCTQFGDVTFVCDVLGIIPDEPCEHFDPRSEEVDWEDRLEAQEQRYSEGLC